MARDIIVGPVPMCFVQRARTRDERWNTDDNDSQAVRLAPTVIL